MWRRCERGSAIADFALVSVVLVPLFFAVLQLALIWHVKTTLTSAASEGARYGAGFDRSVGDGEVRTRQVIDDVFGTGFRDLVSARDATVVGQPAVEVAVVAQVPVLGFWGPTVALQVRGHAIKEVLP
ncbi:MAG: pilus assembly protein [Propionibacteriales bacterium]|nr:pilus assembly protein [Propionibacteriales bacterium]